MLELGERIPPVATHRDLYVWSAVYLRLIDCMEGTRVLKKIPGGELKLPDQIETTHEIAMSQSNAVGGSLDA